MEEKVFYLNDHKFDNFLQQVLNLKKETQRFQEQEMQKEEINHEDEIDRILKDPKKYRKMMLIMQQTLYDLGYHESAKMLESESGVSFYSPQLLSIKQLLEKDDFESAIKIVQELEQNSHQQKLIQSEKMNGSNNIKDNSTKLSLHTLDVTKMMIYQTYCMHKIINQQFQSAMQIISQNIKNQSKKQFLCQALVLGNHHLSKEQLQKKKQGIFKHCLSSWQQIGDKQIQKVIQSYRQHEGGEFINKEIKNLLNQHKLLPPMRIFSVELQRNIKHTITHMRISLQLNTLYIIQEDKDILNVHLITIDNKKLESILNLSGGYSEGNRNKDVLSERMTKSLQMKYKGKRQAVQTIAVNPNAQISNIALAICSFNIIMMLSQNLDVISQLQTNNKIEKYLHLDFHPISQLLYTCGYFETLNAIDSDGQLIQSVYPYPKTRKFLFCDNSHTIGISLVTNKLYKHSLDQQVLEKQIELDQGVVPMDLCISDWKGVVTEKAGKGGYNSIVKIDNRNKTSNNSKSNTINQQYIGVSSLQFIYILDSETLNILGKTISPTNPNKLIIEVKFFDNYLITLAKNFTAYIIEREEGKNGDGRMKDEGVIVNSGERVNDNAEYRQQRQTISISKFRQWSGEGTFQLLLSHHLMLSGFKQLTIWYPGDLQSSQMIDQSQQQLLQVNNNMIEQIQEMISYSESQNDDSSQQSNEQMEEDDDNGQQEEWNEDDSQSGMEMM